MARRVLEISKVDADRFYAECADLFANVPPRSGPQVTLDHEAFGMTVGYVAQCAVPKSPSKA